MQYELINDGVRIQLHDDCGEGWNGDYCPDDSDDEPLLRFDVYRWDSSTNEYVEVNNASYCTRLPASISSDIANAALQSLMNEFGDAVRGGSSIKKCAERMSWIAPSDF
jgi:hypothetical protein